MLLWKSKYRRELEGLKSPPYSKLNKKGISAPRMSNPLRFCGSQTSPKGRYITLRRISAYVCVTITLSAHGHNLVPFCINNNNGCHWQNMHLHGSFREWEEQFAAIAPALDLALMTLAHTTSVKVIAYSRSMGARARLIASWDNDRLSVSSFSKVIVVNLT